VQHLDSRNEVKIAFSDHTKAERVFGKHRETPLAEGVRAMAEWVTAYGARQSSVFENIEVMKNLPPSWAAVAS
jgi:UDP-glucose 4-epimerase